MTADILPIPIAQSKPPISVIMVSYHTGPALFEAIRAVIRDDDIFELIVVDNGNPSEARTRLCQVISRSDKVRLLQGHGNIGFSKACNYGAGFARGDYLLFLNPDTRISLGAARKMADAGEHRDTPWIVGSMLRDVNGREQRGARRRALTPWRAFTTFTGLAKLPFFDPIPMDALPLPEGPQTVDVVSGACMMMNRASFDEVGGFNERYFLHVEDIDICHEVNKAGGEVIFHPGAVVMHYGSTSRVTRLWLEREKLKGFMIFFWKYSDKPWAKLLNVIAWPFMWLAIMGRAFFLTLRTGLTGR